MSKSSRFPSFEKIDHLKAHNFIRFYFDPIPDVLSNKEIINKAKFYKKKLESQCLYYARTLKEIFANLSVIFYDRCLTLEVWYNLLGFYFDNEIRRVLNRESYAVSVNKLKKIRSVISEMKQNKINLRKVKNTFKIICYNCGLFCVYQLNPNSIPKKVRKICPHCNERLTLKVLKERGEYNVCAYRIFEGKIVFKSESEIFREFDYFLCNYISFSSYVTKSKGKRVNFLTFDLEEEFNDLDPKYWLFENIRYAFPEIYDLPISNRVLSWFLFGDPNIEYQYELSHNHLSSNRLSLKLSISVLFKIDYRVRRLSKKDFEKFDIELNNGDLKRLKDYISFIIFTFIFRNPYNIPYVSDSTNSGIPIDSCYFIPDYFAIRSIYFIMCDINKREHISFKRICNILGVRNKFQHSMSRGYTMCSVFYIVVEKVKGLIVNSNIILDKEYVQSFYDSISLFDKVNDLRNEYYRSLLEYASWFQGEVHKFFENYFGVKFQTEKQVLELIKSKFIKINGKRKRIHHNLSFDGYCKLIPSIRKRFGLKEHWKGIIFEAHGLWHIDLDIYLRMFPYKTKSDFKRRLEIDQSKRVLCRKFNYFLIEIYEDMEKNQWSKEILRQMAIQKRNQ